jgi:hypothetical protein
MAATCFNAAPMFEDEETQEQTETKPVRPDLIGQTFRLTRYGKRLVRKINEANNSMGTWGNESSS